MESKRRVGAGTVLLKDIYDLIARTQKPGIHPAPTTKEKISKIATLKANVKKPETWKKGSYTDLSDGTIKELFIRDFSNSNHVELWAVDERGKTKIVEERPH